MSRQTKRSRACTKCGARPFQSCVRILARGTDGEYEVPIRGMHTER